MPDFTPRLADVIDAGILARLESVFTVLVGRVERYDNTRRTADFVSVTHRATFDDAGNRVVEELPLLQNVPVAFMRGGGYSVTHPLSQGDFAILLCTMFNIGEWFETGNIGDPGDTALHSLSGLIALPFIIDGRYTDLNASADAYVVAGDDIRLGSKDAEAYAAEAGKVDDDLEVLKSAIEKLATLTGNTPLISPILADLSADTGCNKVRIE